MAIDLSLSSIFHGMKLVVCAGLLLRIELGEEYAAPKDSLDDPLVVHQSSAH